MAQPAPAPMITPSQTISIKNQTPDQDSVDIIVGELVEIHNEDNVPYEIPISYLDNGSDENYPMALYLPAGGKVYFIGVTAATCNYEVNTAPSASGAGRGLGNGPYSINVDSGPVGGSKK